MKKMILWLLAAVLLLGATGCKSENVAQPAAIDLGSVMQEILAIEQLPEMMTLTQDDLLDYCGLEQQWCADCVACINSNGFEKDEIIIVRAVDADSVPLIRECLQQSLENAANEMRDYLPDQYAMIRNCKTESRDLYVWLFISDAADQMRSILDRYLNG